MKWVCKKCKGTNIQFQAWVDANTTQYISDAGPDGECWCDDCCETTEMIHTQEEEKDLFEDDPTITIRMEVKEEPKRDWWIALNTPGCSSSNE